MPGTRTAPSKAGDGAGQPDGEDRALAGRALHLDRAAVALDDLQADRQAEARPAAGPGPRGEERREDAAPRLGVHADATSATTTPTRSGSPRVVTRSSPPCGMASMALLNRFSRTCLKASGSISRQGTSP